MRDSLTRGPLRLSLPGNLTHFCRYITCTVIAAFMLASTVSADTIHLKNGNTIEGRILEETADGISISTGASEMLIPMDRVDRIERKFAFDFIAQRATRALQTGNRMIDEGQLEEAGNVIQDAIRSLDEELEGVTDPPAELGKLRAQLEALRLKAIPQDPRHLKAEELYQKALRHLDHIEYELAFQTLKEASDLAPRRADIQFRLGDTARQTKHIDEAIAAWRATLDLDVEGYFDDVSEPMLGLLHEKGRTLLANRKADEALEFYEQALLLEGSQTGKPTDISTFLARRTSHDSKPEDERLMEIYKYADDRDLVDLAYAAISEVQVLRPDDPQVQRLEAETGFLANFRRAVVDGNVDAAARLLSNTPDSIKEDPDIARRMKNFSGDMGPEVQSQTLLKQAEAALADGKYAEAQTLAEKIIVDFPTTSSSTRAAEILREAKLEGPVLVALTSARELHKANEYDEALNVLDDALGIVNVSQSRYHDKLVALQTLIPREREADGIWTLAKAHLDRDEFDEAMEVLQRLSKDFGDTMAGARARAWLDDYSRRLNRAANRKRLTDESFFSFVDAGLWRAASIPATSNSSRPPQLPEAVRVTAWGEFDKILNHDAESRADTRNPIFYVGFPFLLGGVLLIGLLWTMARPGSGQYKEPDEIEEEEFEEDKPVICRACGQTIPRTEAGCPACGTGMQLSDVEQEREEDAKRQAEFDPWDVRVHADKENEFEKHFQKARDLSETSDVQAAIEQCRMALHEDPHAKAGYELLAELYDRIGQDEEAAKCYREVLLIDPNDINVRQKIDAKLTLSTSPINLGALPIVLSICLWWTVFWIVYGIDSQWALVRAGMCGIAAVLTVVVWRQVQKRTTFSYIAKDKQFPDIIRPLPNHDLSWKEQSRQAKLLCGLVHEHTGMPVPTLSVGRFFLTLGLTLLLLVALIGIAWENFNLWVLLAWPSGAILLVYCFEIHPRVMVAHAILRHCFEETVSTWVDPHRPFKPKGFEEVKGDFLINSPEELPVRWAMKPKPYSPNRQGILNSIQQTLNRHWDFHHFYHNLHVVRDVDVPMPAGFRFMSIVGVLLIVAAFMGATSSRVQKAQEATSYRNALHTGYQYLLDGDPLEARGYFESAVRQRPEDVAPNLYLAHANAAAGFPTPAERSFNVATGLPETIAAAYNDFGNFLQREGRMRDAVEQYKLALTIDGDDPYILNNLGSAFFKMKELRQAVHYLNRAVTANPGHSRAWTTLGLAYEGLGDMEEARAAYEKAIEVASKIDYTQIARDRLEADLRVEEGPLTLEVSMAETNDRRPAN